MRRQRAGARERVAFAILGLFISGFVVVARADRTPSTRSEPTSSDQPFPVLQQGVAPTSTAEPTPVTHLPTPGPSTPQAGEPFSSPALAANDVTLIRTDALPSISQEQAMQAVVDLGVPWGNGGTWEGKPVTVQAFYGLAAFGGPGPGGIWEGERNIPLPSGERLDHIEGRSMWIIDYGNTVFWSSGSGCPECPEPPSLLQGP